MIEKLLINNCRKAMLDNITALDKKTLQRELESHLKLEFKYKDEVDNLNNIINETQIFLKEEYKKSTIEKKYGVDYAYALVNMWNKIEELKERYQWKKK